MVLVWFWWVFLVAVAVAVRIAIDIDIAIDIASSFAVVGLRFVLVGGVFVVFFSGHGWRCENHFPAVVVPAPAATAGR